MRHDIQPNERAFSSKEVAEEMNIASATVRRYGQILERNGYEFFKDGERRIFVRSDIEALIAFRDSERPKDEMAGDLARQQKERLEESDTTDMTIPDTYAGSIQDPAQLHDFLKVIANELAASREMNVQLTQDMEQLKTTVARLQQDHHVISSGVGNFSQKTHTKIDKLTEQQNNHYEELLKEEKRKSEALHKELQDMREEQRKEWRAQNDFNQQLAEAANKSKGSLGKLFSLFRK
ncbi:hypothetical protein LF817_09630 [Halobacillus sp. A1]|uniref:hypothetical protein n=1 Tax=Halobacillus sp. A1 TaxID=2880262 RepID=UPI0020A6C5A3|nr:hypothetical protein [Halobacillus sp. A1]MCP3031610.1 hypothetical protein [Halobacillus sp. A1]